MIVGYDTEHERDEPMAGQMVYDLVQAYPGHAWFVTIKGGVIFVKDMDINDRWGMALHYSDVKTDAADRKKSLLRSAGEFLERANLKRGAKTEQHVFGVEGIPQKDMRPQ